MGRIGSFVLGTIVGAGGIHTATNFHVIRANEGTVLVRKLQPGLHSLYADIRQFGVDDWRRNPDLARAMLLHQRKQNSSSQPLDDARKSVGSLLAGVLGNPQ